jgi:hypothetical protein
MDSVRDQKVVINLRLNNRYFVWSTEYPGGAVARVYLRYARCNATWDNVRSASECDERCVSGNKSGECISNAYLLSGGVKKLW